MCRSRRLPILGRRRPEGGSVLRQPCLEPRNLSGQGHGDHFQVRTRNHTQWSVSYRFSERMSCCEIIQDRRLGNDHEMPRLLITGRGRALRRGEDLFHYYVGHWSDLELSDASALRNASRIVMCVAVLVSLVSIGESAAFSMCMDFRTKLVCRVHDMQDSIACNTPTRACWSASFGASSGITAN